MEMASFGNTHLAHKRHKILFGNTHLVHHNTRFYSGTPTWCIATQDLKTEVCFCIKGNDGYAAITAPGTEPGALVKVATAAAAGATLLIRVARIYLTPFVREAHFLCRTANSQ